MISIDENARKRFESDWREGHSLSIREYLPNSGTDTYIGTLEELVCIDMEFRWRPEQQHGSNSERTLSVAESTVQTRVEDYLREFPELDDEEIIRRLVEQEIFVRVNAGYVVEPSEYQSRFPHFVLEDSLFSSSEGESTRVDPNTSLRPGAIEFPTQLGGYTLVSRLGEGGMGTVYRAQQESAGREVALKVAHLESLRPDSREQMVQRFQKEAYAAAALHHDHVVPIFDVGVVNDQPYMAMQLVDGGDLGSRSKEEPFSSKAAAQYLLGVARGVEKAHARGLLHRDIKPANILVDSNTDRAMLTDFGLVRDMEEESGMTQQGQLLGTPSFMAPEQIRDSSKIDARADIYALGGTLYQLLTGRPPFKASDMRETLRQVLGEDVVAPRTLNPGIDQDLDTICLKCLEKEPAARYQTAQELSTDLALYLEGKPIHAKPASAFNRFTKWCKRNKALAASLALANVSLLVAAVVGVSGYVITSNRVAKQRRVLNVSHETLGNIVEVIRNEPGLSNPDNEPMKIGLLETILDSYTDLANATDGDAPLKDKHAYALAVIAQTKSELRFPVDEQQSSLRKALTSIESLPADERTTPELLAAQSDVQIWLGRIASNAQRLDEGQQRFEAATRLRKQWTEKQPKNDEAQRKLANSIMNEAIVARMRSEEQLYDGKQNDARANLAVAEGKLRDAQKLRYEIAEPRNEKVRRDIAKAHYNLAKLELLFGDIDEAVIEVTEASERLGALAREVQVDPMLWERFVESRLLEAKLVLESPIPNQLPPERIEQSATLVNVALNDLQPLVILRERLPKAQRQLAFIYQDGVDVLIGCSAFEAAQQHSAFLRNALSSQFLVSEVPADGARKLERDAIVLMLNMAKHDAILAFELLEDDSQASKVVEEAIGQFHEHVDVVNSDAMLASAFESLRAILEELKRFDANN